MIRKLLAGVAIAAASAGGLGYIVHSAIRQNEVAAAAARPGLRFIALPSTSEPCPYPGPYGACMASPAGTVVVPQSELVNPAVKATSPAKGSTGSTSSGSKPHTTVTVRQTVTTYHSPTGGTSMSITKSVTTTHYP